MNFSGKKFYDIGMVKKQLENDFGISKIPTKNLSAAPTTLNILFLFNYFKRTELARCLHGTPPYPGHHPTLGMVLAWWI